jgi:hypothetical protein
MQAWLLIHRTPISAGLVITIVMAALGWLDAEIAYRRSGHAPLWVIGWVVLPLSAGSGIYYGTVGWGVFGWTTMLAYAFAGSFWALIWFGLISGWDDFGQTPIDKSLSRQLLGRDYSDLP